MQGGRYVADHIPGARLLEVDGTDHAPWFTDPDRITTAIEEFLTGSHAAPSQSHRALRTVLFTDMVASTQHVAATGDERWRAVLHRLGEITADLTERFGGTVVKSTGDGHLPRSTAPRRPSAAPRPCAITPRHWASRSALASTPASANCWTPTSGGIAVHIAARILGQAGAGRDPRFPHRARPGRRLGYGFEDRGSVELRGVPGTWQLLAVDPHGARAGSVEAQLASTPTPGPQAGMRRTDRAMAVMAKRTPWILRGMARLAPAADRPAS